jgi:hypothetical protein
MGNFASIQLGLLEVGRICGGRVNAIALAPDAMYAGTDGGGVWVSRDYRNARPTWTPLTDNLPTAPEKKVGLLAVRSVAVDPRNPASVFATTDAGIIQSADSGASWTKLLDKGTFGATTFARILIDPRNAWLYVATNAGVLISSSRGQTWSVAVPTGSSGLVTDIDYTLSADSSVLTLYAGVTFTPGDASANGIYVSTDDGGLWRPMPMPLTSYVSRQVVAANTLMAIIFAADHRPGSPLGTYAVISTNDVLSKSGSEVLNIYALDSGAWVPTVQNLAAPLNTQAAVNQALALSITGALYLGVSSDGTGYNTLLSMDQGRTWVEISQGTNGLYSHVDNHALVCDGPVLYTGDDGGIFRYTPPANGAGFPGTWESLNTDRFNTLELYDLAVNPADPQSLLWAMQDNGVALSSMTSLLEVQGADGNRVAFTVHPTTRQQIAYSSLYDDANSAYYRSENGGSTWSRFALPPGYDGNVHQPLRAHPTRGRVLLTNQAQLIEWDEVESAWHWIIPGPTPVTARGNINGLAYSHMPYIYYATYDSGEVFRFFNANGDWTEVQVSQIADGRTFGGMIKALAVDPQNPESVFIATDAAQIWNRLGGSQWTNVTGDFPTLAASALAVQHPHRGVEPVVIVGTVAGAFSATAPTAGAIWTSVGIPDVAVTAVECCFETGITAIGTYGRGAFIEDPCAALQQAFNAADGQLADLQSQIDSLQQNDDGILAELDGASPTEKAGILKQESADEKRLEKMIVKLQKQLPALQAARDKAAAALLACRSQDVGFDPCESLAEEIVALNQQIARLQAQLDTLQAEQDLSGLDVSDLGPRVKPTLPKGAAQLIAERKKEIADLKEQIAKLSAQRTLAEIALMNCRQPQPL